MDHTKKIKDFETFKFLGMHYIKGGNDGDIGHGDKKEGKDKEKRKSITILGIPIPGTGN